MVKNYLKVGFRAILRRKGHTLLNIIGLSIGLTCTFLIALWILNETSYDDFHKKGDRLYRVLRNARFGDEVFTSETSPWPLVGELTKYSAVENVAVITAPRYLTVNRNESPFRVQGIYANIGFFKAFSWKIVLGEVEETFENSKSIVISESLANKYFGNEWRSLAIGGIIYDHVTDLGELLVTGVFQDIPSNSTLSFDFILPVNSYLESQDSNRLNDWNNSDFKLFLELRNDQDPSLMVQEIKYLQNDHVEDFESEIFLQLYGEQHLNSNFENGRPAGGRIEYVKLFSIIAIMVILIACINFINLSTAHSTKRSKEIGIRKAIGAGRWSLVQQYLGESIMLTFVAFLLALILLIPLLPIFNDLTGQQVMLSKFKGTTLLWFIGIGILTAFISGIYPALYISSFSATKIFSGKLQANKSNSSLRKTLVIFQFAMAVILIIGTVTIYNQVKYIHAKNLGFDRENVIYLLLQGSMREKFELVKQELLQKPGIVAVTASNTSPIDVRSSTHNVNWKGKVPTSQVEMHVLSVDHNFLEAMKMDLLQGANFSTYNSEGSKKYIVNETAANTMGFTDPVGEELNLWGKESGTIVGVVKDFHMSSLYTQIEPTILRLNPASAQWLYVRAEAGMLDDVLPDLEQLYGTFMPQYPFEYRFLDDSFNQMYKSETVIGKLIGYFSILALSIACLGLIGLAGFTADSRAKEIAVRKVYGANISNIVSLLNFNFLKLVLLGFVIAAPISWIIVNDWISNFAYRIDIGIKMYMLVGGLVMVVSIITVSWHSIKAALLNPVESLRE